MKIYSLAFILSLLLFLVCTSCNYEPNMGPDGGAGDESDPSVQQVNRDFTELKKFARTALGDGSMEIELSQIAIENTGNRGVERLAEMIKNDHRKANQKLDSLLDHYEWNISAEMTDKQEQKVEQLQEAPEEEIDKRYLRMTIESHEKAIRNFEAVLSPVDGEAGERENEMQAPYAAAVGAPELKRWIDNTLPVLKKHLDQARQVQSQLQ